MLHRLHCRAQAALQEWMPACESSQNAPKARGKRESCQKSKGFLPFTGCIGSRIFDFNILSKIPGNLSDDIRAERDSGG